MRTFIPALAIAASVLCSPMPALAQCNAYCSVGARGTGGENSDGRAQGFLDIGPGRTAGFDVFNSGNSDAGHFAVEFEGDLVGTRSGTLRDGICRDLETGRLGDDRGLDPDC